MTLTVSAQAIRLGVDADGFARTTHRHHIRRLLTIHPDGTLTYTTRSTP